MKAAVLGRGGREHALARRLADDLGEGSVSVWPGNAGIPGSTGELPRGPELVSALRARGVTLVVVGPEALLAEGVADDLRQEGFDVVGPSREGSKLETSKAFAKDLLRRHGIPTARAVVLEGPETDARLEELPGAGAVVKFDGLAEGKGVVVCDDRSSTLSALRELRERYGESGPFLVEERLTGPELSVMTFVSDGSFVVLPESRDHKRLEDHDRGPNTGGMGAFSPVPGVDEALRARIDEIVEKTVRGLGRDGIAYRGFLYVGLMLTPDGPKVLEFNVRFGDPEAEAVLPRIGGSFVDLCVQCARGFLGDARVVVRPEHVLAVVLARRGYPKAASGESVRIARAEIQADETSHVCVASAEALGDDLVLAKGRALVVVAEGASLDEARSRAYTRVERLARPGLVFRRDIARTTPEAVRPKRIAVLASGRGSNLRALHAATLPGGVLHGIGEIVFVGGDKPDALALAFAKEQGIATSGRAKTGLSREAWDRAMLADLAPFDVDLVVLAGFMRVLSTAFVEAYAGRIVNVHPADTREHRGLGGYEHAFEARRDETRITVHLVDAGLDTGTILAQRSVDLRGASTLDEVERRGLAVEHALYPEAVRDFLLGRIGQEGT